MSLYQLLTDRRAEVVKHFVAVVTTQEIAPEGTPRSHLVDHIPKFLDEIIEELREREAVRNSQDAFDVSLTARRHGTQRWSLGYDLEALVREYGILRHCVMNTIKTSGVAVTIDEFDVLAKCLNVGVAEAATAYANYCDGELRAQKADLEFLAEAGQLLTASLDLKVTLSRLGRLIVPRLGDWCIVHIEGALDADEVVVAHIDATRVEPLRELYRHFCKLGEPWNGYAAMQEKKTSVLVSEVPGSLTESLADHPEQLASFKAIRPHAWMLVPLLVHDEVLGALICGLSDGSRSYAPASVSLAEELARRAAVAIQNARLYELSQRERTRVEEATRAKDEFVAMLSHELRTPLNAMLGWSKLLRAGALAEDKRGHALEVIERNAAAQSQLVADLLDVSRIISGKIRLNLAQVDPAGVLEMVIEGVRPAAEGKRVQIQTAVAPDVGTLRGDPDRLQQVFWNLLTNAVKFSARGGAVRVALARVESHVQVVVQDSGIGIAPDLLPRVFDRFRQGDEGSARAFGGLGLGLAIVKHLVELHGGTVAAESGGVGRGAAFTVTLPISPLLTSSLVLPRERATTEETERPSTPEFDLTGVRGLIIDDEPDARELLEMVLSSYGMVLQSVGGAEDALERLRTFTPDVILSDVGMPETDGYTLIRKVRMLEDAEKKNVPAIALTAFARNEDRTRALLAGFNAHLAKPVEPVILGAMIADLVGRVGSKP